MIKLSVVISAYNEEKKIEDCLKSVSFADEIIFVDNGSTDKTSEIASKYTSKIFIRPNNLMLNINKNFGFTKATNEWILSLDADERVSKGLEEEIKKVIGKSGGDPSTCPAKRDFAQDDSVSVNGYWIPRKNIIFGKWIQHTGWYPDHQLRLFKKGLGKFPEEHVHEMIKIEGEASFLNHSIVHYNYETIFQFMQKLINIYAPNEADQLLKNGYKFIWQDAIRFPVKEFLSRFFAREGYKDGFHGLMLSILMAFYQLVVFSLIWERHNFKKVDDPTLLEYTEKELTQSFKEIFFWFSEEKTKRIKSSVFRSLYKVLNKLKR